MEFTLDVPFIRDILEREHSRARDEIRDLGVLRALESSQHRHDARDCPIYCALRGLATDYLRGLRHSAHLVGWRCLCAFGAIIKNLVDVRVIVFVILSVGLIAFSVRDALSKRPV